MRTFISKCIRTVRDLELIGLRSRPAYDGEKDRFRYQARYHDFHISPEDQVLDVGCGAYPFPYATMLVDLYTETSRHRNEELRTDGKPFKVCDINHLPFGDKSFDFVYCSHVLEHVDDPKRACGELARVGKRGYIETPSLMSDALFAWAQGMHKWFTVTIGNRLVFFEYDERRSQGVRNSYWGKAIFSGKFHPLQEVFFQNMDIFNNSLLWRNSFDYSIFYVDGRSEHSDGRGLLAGTKRADVR